VHIKQRKKVSNYTNLIVTTSINTYLTVNKQINDKERIAAAMENPNLRELVENCIKDEE